MASEMEHDFDTFQHIGIEFLQAQNAFKYQDDRNGFTQLKDDEIICKWGLEDNVRTTSSDQQITGRIAHQSAEQYHCEGDLTDLDHISQSIGNQAIVRNRTKQTQYNLRRSIIELRGRPIKNIGKKLKDFHMDFVKQVVNFVHLPPFRKKHLNRKQFLEKLLEFGPQMVRQTLETLVSQTPSWKIHQQRDKETAYRWVHLSLLNFIRTNGEIPQRKRLKELMKS